MTDPTTPTDPKPETTAETTADTTEIPAVPAETPKAETTKVADPKVADDPKAAGSEVAGDPKVAGDVKVDGKKKRRGLRGAWATVGGAVVLLLALSVVGYVWGLGPLSTLNAKRGINPPAKLDGLDRITDKEIRDQLQLDQTKEALSRINNGKQATVEAYGTIDGNRMFVIIALRGKVDIDKTVADSGATPDKVKKVGKSTCVESTGNLPTQCYRGSNTLTVIAQSANEGVTVDQVEPVAEEAFKAMR
ncbi:hypothetical protein [Kribbella solani]|uniref:hypothetical protein n=1 Tax=Kribbella solani TaxID=236067 RepID=UPI0029BE37DC|nr:hypothetical protein [Kribbella solani]MDX2971050.1 hypothetical protein [Kribbella solani]